MGRKTASRPESAGREKMVFGSQSKLRTSGALVFGLAACASSAFAQQPQAGTNGAAINQAPSSGVQQQTSTTSVAAEPAAASASGNTQNSVPTDQTQPGATKPETGTASVPAIPATSAPASSGAQNAAPTGQAQPGGAEPETGAASAPEKPEVPAVGTTQNTAPADQGQPGAAQPQTGTEVAGEAAAGATIRDVVVTSTETAAAAPPPPPPPPPAPAVVTPIPPLQELAKPGTGVTGEVLQKEQKTTISDFTQSAPSLTVTAPNPRNIRIFIRGIGKTSTVEALQNSVGINVDGVVMTSDAQIAGEFTDLNRLDVLRGPQGFTFGRNATLGVLYMTTKPPSFIPEQEVAVTYGNRNLFETTGSSTGTIVDNVLAYRASFYVKSQDGFINSTVPNYGPWDDTNRWGGRLQFLYTPNPNVTNRTILDHEESLENQLVTYAIKDVPNWTDTGTPRPITFTSRLARFGYSTTYNPFGTSDVKQQLPVKSSNDGVSSQTDWKLDGGYTLTSITAWRDYYFNAFNDNDLTRLNANQGGYITNGMQVSQELRITSPKEQEILGQKFDYTFGLFSLHSDYDANLRYLYGTDAGKFYASNAQYAALIGNQQALVNALNGVKSYQTEHPTDTSVAAYGQTTWHATDRWDLTLGFRNTYESEDNWTQKWYTGGVNLASLYSGATLANTAAIRKTVLALFTAGTNPIDGQAINADMWQWQFNPSYKVTDNILAYFSSSYGEKAGAVQFNPVTGLPQNVLPEQVMDYELGLRTTWFDKKLTLNPNLYWTDIENYQSALAVILPGQLTTTSVLGNIPELRNRGVEIDGNYKTPLDGLNLTFSGSYQDATTTVFPNSPCPGDLSYASTRTCNLSGQPYAGVSRWIGTIGTDYSTSIWDGYTGYFFANETFRSRANLAQSLSIYGWQSDYSITNAGIGFHPDNNAWDVSFWGKNIFNTHYYTAITTVSPSAPVTGVIGDPLVFGVTFKMKL